MQMRSDSENDMAEPGPQWASEGTAGPSGGGRVTKITGSKPTDPWKSGGGVRCSAPAAEDLERRGDLSPQRGIGDRPEVTRALGPRSGHQPADPTRAPSSLQQFSPLLTSSTRGNLVPHPIDQQVAAPQAKFTPTASPPASSAPAPTLPSRGTLVPPVAKLTRPGVFLRSFPVHLDACPAAGSFAFLHLPVRSSLPPPPPSSHLRRSPDLVGGSC